ncbi:MAG: MFS transporter [Pseudomonadota bacterium]
MSSNSSSSAPFLRSPSAGILGAIACTTIFALTFGLTYPLFAFVLEAQGWDEAAIGINAATTPLGILLASPLYPRLAQRFGSWQVASLCLVMIAVLFIAMGLTRDYWTLMVLRFLLGVTETGVFIISETWINQLAVARSRGRIVGLYATALSGGFAAGPLILSATGVEGFAPFAVAALLCGLSILVVLTIRKATPDVTHEKAASPWSFVRLAPTLLVAITVFAFWDGALLSLFPLYGLDHGFEARFITFALAVCVLGNTFLQIPIGWLADRTSRRGVMIACALIAGSGAIALPASVAAPTVVHLALLFFWGAACGGLYTMAMAELGDRFSGAQLVAGNAAFAIAFGLGGMFGGPATGMAMNLTGTEGFSQTLSVIFFATAAYAWWRRRAGGRGG